MEDSLTKCLSGWDYTSLPRSVSSTTTVTDELAGKVVGKPYWGKPAVRFDEGAEGKAVMGNWEPDAHTERVRYGNPPPKTARTKVLLYWTNDDKSSGHKCLEKRSLKF